MERFATIVNYFRKTLHLRCLKGSEYASGTAVHADRRLMSMIKSSVLKNFYCGFKPFFKKIFLLRIKKNSLSYLDLLEQFHINSLV